MRSALRLVFQLAEVVVTKKMLATTIRKRIHR